MISNNPYSLLTDFLLSLTVQLEDITYSGKRRQWWRRKWKDANFTDTVLSKFVNTDDRDLHVSWSYTLMQLFSAFRDWFRQIGKTTRVWQVGFPHSPAIWQATVIWDKVYSVTPADSCFFSSSGYCTFSLLIFRKVFEPNRRVTVGRDPMFVTVL